MISHYQAGNAPPVILCGDCDDPVQRELLARFGLQLERVGADDAIPGSFWGAPEAGLSGSRIFVRQDTPLHSMLHEAAHYICMDAGRRQRLDTDAGGDFAEENAVCLLQILLADHLPCCDRQRIMQDMDSWGYTFRLGSASAWFQHDAGDAQHWLLVHGLIDDRNQPTWRVNQCILNSQGD